MIGLLDYINNEIKEHIDSGYCTNYDIALDQVAQNVEIGADYMYDIGRYDTLLQFKKLIEEVIKNEV